MQHHLGISLFSKGGVYGASETMEAIREPADRDVDVSQLGQSFHEMRPGFRQGPWGH